MSKQESKIFLIDDDEGIRQSIGLLLKSKGYEVETFASIDRLLEKENYKGIGCILLDVFLEGKSGLELQAEIETKFECLPIIFISGQGNIPMSVEAMKKGALNFLLKPIDDKELIKAIEEAFERSNVLLTKQYEINRFKTLINLLTAREYEIFCFVITGSLNKQIAAELRIAEHTVKNHRLKITEKLAVKSVAEMVYIADRLNIKSGLQNY
ncbi:MAG: response regulator transcription factor [Ignavibacteriales bacterium]